MILPKMLKKEISLLGQKIKIVITDYHKLIQLIFRWAMHSGAFESPHTSQHASPVGRAPYT